MLAKTISYYKSSWSLLSNNPKLFITGIIFSLLSLVIYLPKGNEFPINILGFVGNVGIVIFPFVLVKILNDLLSGVPRQDIKYKPAIRRAIRGAIIGSIIVFIVYVLILLISSVIYYLTTGNINNFKLIFQIVFLLSLPLIFAGSYVDIYWMIEEKPFFRSIVESIKLCRSYLKETLLLILPSMILATLPIVFWNSNGIQDSVITITSSILTMLSTGAVLLFYRSIKANGN